MKLPQLFTSYPILQKKWTNLEKYLIYCSTLMQDCVKI